LGEVSAAATTLIISPTVFSQIASDLMGAWKDISISSVIDAERFHPNEAGKEGAIWAF
jgi:hypothetical protein